MDCEIKNKQIEQKQWLELAGVNLADLAADIDRYIAGKAAERLQVIETIQGLDSAKEYELLHLRYIQGMPLKDIADRWGWDYSRVTTMHRRALKHVQALLDHSAHRQPSEDFGDSNASVRTGSE